MPSVRRAQARALGVRAEMPAIGADRSKCDTGYMIASNGALCAACEIWIFQQDEVACKAKSGRSVLFS